MDCDFQPHRVRILTGIRILALSTVFCLSPAGFALGADSTLSTRGNESLISRDQAGGDRVMRTPDPKPQQDYQGPRTIIVAPEVYPDGYPGKGRDNNRMRRRHPE